MEQVTAGQPTISLRFASDSCIDTSWNIWNKESGCRSLHRRIMASTLMSQNYPFLLTFRAFLFTLFFCFSPVILTIQLSSQFVFFRGSANIRWHLSLAKDLLCKMNERSWSFLLIVFIIDMYSELKSYISKHCCTLSHFSSVWLCNPLDCCLSRLLCLWDCTGKDTAVDSHSLLQESFLTQRFSLSLLHCKRILYHLSLKGSWSKHYMM